MKKNIGNKNFLSISKASKILGVSPDTLRNWERQGKIIPDRTSGGARRFSLSELNLIKRELGPRVKNKSGYLPVSKAANLLKISPDTLRSWDKRKIIGGQRTEGGARRYSRAEVKRVQKELGIENEIVAKGVEKPRPNFGFWKISSILTFVAVLLILAGFLLKPSQAPEIKDSQKDVLGEKTESLESKVSDIVSILENLQKSVNNLQSEEKKVQYINLPQSSAPDLQISGVVDGDLTPDKNDAYNLGSSTAYFKQGYIAQFSSNTINTANFKINDINFLSGSELPENNLGGVGDYYLRKKDSEANLYLKTGTGWSSFNIASLQKVYEAGNSIATLDGKDIKIDLSNTTTDANFLINILGKDSSFRINDTLGQASFIVKSDGKIGLGVDNPTSKLDIVDQSGSGPTVVIKNSAATPNTDILKIISDGVTLNNTIFRVDSEGDLYLDGSIYASSTVITSGNADIAEEYNVIDGASEGDIVVTVGSTNIAKSTSPYQKEILGVISTQPGFKLSLKDAINPKPVVLAGRVSVKVSNENGLIKIGDFLTSSSTGGIAMKATRPGQVIGKALEDFNEEKGVIPVFINISFADPGQSLANLTLDQDGNLIMPKLKVASLQLGPIDQGIALAKPESGSNTAIYTSTQPIDVVSKMEQLQSQFLSLQIENTSNYKDLQKLQAKVEDLESTLAKGLPENHESSVLAATIPSQTDMKDALITPQKENMQLDLISPGELFATASATYADLKVTETFSSEKLFTSLDATVSGIFKALGNVELGQTTIAGDLVVDGTLSITNGNQLDVVGDGILYLQKNTLAKGLDLFNGLVTVDRTGKIIAQTILVGQFKVMADKISGSGTIPKGKKTAEIQTPLVEKNSRILITPTTETDMVLAVTEKIDKKKFTVSAPKTVEDDINFDWWMVNEEKVESKDQVD